MSDRLDAERIEAARRGAHEFMAANGMPASLRGLRMSPVAETWCDDVADAVLAAAAGVHIQPAATDDPVQVREMWQATCDSCGWHVPPTSPRSVVREWARLHRVTCPLKPAAASSEGTH